MSITFVIFLILMYLINIVEKDWYTTVFNAFDHSQFPKNFYTAPYNASNFH